MTVARLDSLPPRPPLNSVCPYYTMFPIDFPRRVLSRAKRGDVVADPYCGRGTTLYAARELGLEAHGTDISPVAVAISKAKLVHSTRRDVLRAYDRLLAAHPEPIDVPSSNFWALAYHPDTLRTLCRLREALLAADRPSEPAAVSHLRAIVLGALHGPLNTGATPSSFFSNQMMRSFAPKPDYAVRFWTARHMVAPPSDVRAVIDKRAQRILQDVPRRVAMSSVKHLDARRFVVRRLARRPIRWVVTSPPYYGMRTYEVDQWLRTWFAGGPDRPGYNGTTQLSHQSPNDFAAELGRVWSRVGRYCDESTRVIVRFGAIGSRSADYDDILKTSLAMSTTGWRVRTSRPAGSAIDGRRQACHMGERGDSQTVAERDYYIGM